MGVGREDIATRGKKPERTERDRRSSEGVGAPTGEERRAAAGGGGGAEQNVAGARGRGGGKKITTYWEDCTLNAPEITNQSR